MVRGSHTINLDEVVWERLEKEHSKTQVPIARIIERAVCKEFGLEVPA